jgi:hypothetical protein
MKQMKLMTAPLMRQSVVETSAVSMQLKLVLQLQKLIFRKASLTFDKSSEQ